MAGGRTSKSFTLIELLVVVAIIAVLVAVLLPSLQKARARALETTCQARLRQWGVTLANYANDNGERLIYRYWEPVYQWWWTWEIKLVDLKYVVNDREVNRCPAETDKSKVTYASNAYLWGIDYTPRPNDAVVDGVLNKVKTEWSQSIAMCEKQHDFNDYWHWGPGAWQHPHCWPLFHRGSNNFLFLDGHVAWMEDTGRYQPWTPINVTLHRRHWVVGWPPL